MSIFAIKNSILYKSIAAKHISLAKFHRVKHRYINRIDLLISGREQEQPNKLRSRYMVQELKLPKSFPAIPDGYRKHKKNCPSVWEREFKAFPLGNI